MAYSAMESGACSDSSSLLQRPALGNALKLSHCGLKRKGPTPAPEAVSSYSSQLDNYFRLSFDPSGVAKCIFVSKRPRTQIASRLYDGEFLGSPWESLGAWGLSENFRGLAFLLGVVPKAERLRKCLEVHPYSRHVGSYSPKSREAHSG